MRCCVSTLYLANWKSVNSDGLSDAKTSVSGTKLSRERLEDFLSICTVHTVHFQAYTRENIVVVVVVAVTSSSSSSSSSNSISLP